MTHTGRALREMPDLDPRIANAYDAFSRAWNALSATHRGHRTRTTRDRARDAAADAARSLVATLDTLGAHAYTERDLREISDRRDAAIAEALCRLIEHRLAAKVAS